MDILKIKYGIRGWRRINLLRSVEETYFFAIFKNQAKQNMTKSALEDNLVCLRYGT